MRRRNWARHPLQLAKAAVAAGLAERFGSAPEEAARLAEVESAKADPLRKLSALAFAERLGLEGAGQRGGGWKFTRDDELLAELVGALPVRLRG